mgnify:CR=1 FL=1
MQSKFISLLSGAALSLGLVTAASAADMAARPYTKAPAPMVAAMYDWSGFYIGANGGWGSSRKCWDIINDAGVILVPPGFEGCHDATGATFGGQIGYRWQMSSWVFGLEAQGNWADFKGSNVNLFFPGVLDESKIDAFGLFTAQIGYAWNNVLVYVKGGAAVTRDKYATYNIPTGLANDYASENRWGGVVGVGLEYGFAPNWSLAFEYDHMFMGSRDVNFYTSGNFGPAGAFSTTDRIDQDVDLITVRLNYKFGMGRPVVARY